MNDKHEKKALVRRGLPRDHWFVKWFRKEYGFWCTSGCELFWFTLFALLVYPGKLVIAVTPVSLLGEDFKRFVPGAAQSFIGLFMVVMFLMLSLLGSILLTLLAGAESITPWAMAGGTGLVLVAMGVTWVLGKYKTSEWSRRGTESEKERVWPKLKDALADAYYSICPYIPLEDKR